MGVEEEWTPEWSTSVIDFPVTFGKSGLNLRSHTTLSRCGRRFPGKPGTDPASATFFQDQVPDWRLRFVVSSCRSRASQLPDPVAERGRTLASRAESLARGAASPEAAAGHQNYPSGLVGSRRQRSLRRQHLCPSVLPSIR